MTVKLKIIILGPQQAGKSLLTNILADMTDNVNTEYDPTVGLRIVETELPLPGGNVAEIELWDCSGSPKYQMYWPVMQLEAHGIIFVYNAESNDWMQELQLFYDYFVVQSNLKDNHCLVIQNKLKETDNNVYPKYFEDLMCVSTNVINNRNTLKSNFNNFIETLIQSYE